MIADNEGESGDVERDAPECWILICLNRDGAGSEEGEEVSVELKVHKDWPIAGYGKLWNGPDLIGK